MAEENRPVAVYVDLDSLLDFRYATLVTLNDEYASTLLNDVFIDRDRDDEFFLPAGITAEQFKAAYAARDATYLPRAKPTGIYWLLGKIISEHLLVQDVPRSELGLTLVINVWPFVLSDEARNVLENAVSIYLDAKIDITSINEDPANITPLMMKNRFRDVVMYDFNYWINAHVTVLTQTMMHPTSIYTPALRRGHQVERERYEELKTEYQNNVNPFEWTTQWLMDNVILHYVDTRFFSIELFNFPVGKTA